MPWQKRELRMDPWVCTMVVFSLQLALWVQFIGQAYVPMMPFTTKQRLNFISVWHNMGCLLLGLGYWWTQWNLFVAALGVWSTTYFLADSINYKPGSLMQWHHYSSAAVELGLLHLYYFPNDINGQAIFWGLIGCEWSNVPMYYVYHVMHSEPHRSVARTVLIWQWLQFVLVRTYCWVIYAWVTPVTWVGLQYIMGGFWLVSMHWAYKMWKNICAS